MARHNDASGAAILRQASKGRSAGLDGDSRLEALVALLRLGDAAAARELRRNLREGREREMWAIRRAFRIIFRERMPVKTWKADARRMISEAADGAKRK